MNKLVLERVANGYILSNFIAENHCKTLDDVRVFNDLGSLYLYLIALYEPQTDKT